MRNLCDEFADFKALADAMVESGVDLSATKSQISGELIDAVSLLLERAQVSGRIRPDVNISDVSAMMAGLSHADPMFMDPSQRKRCVALVCDSLLVGARSVLPQCADGSVLAGSRQDGLSVLLISQASRSMARCLPIGTCSDRSPPADRTLRSISHVPRSSRESRTSSTRMIACPLGDSSTTGRAARRFVMVTRPRSWFATRE